MRKRGRAETILVALAAGTVLLAASVLLMLRRPPMPEPTYGAKPLSAWLRALNVAGTEEEAEHAILSFGSNAVPALVYLLRTPDPVLARPVQAIGRRSPMRMSRLLYRLVNPFAAPAQRAQAARALRTLGPQAQAALPALTNALRDDQTVSWYAALALAQFGGPGITALTNALPSSSPEQARCICYALGTQGMSASNAIPALARLIETGPPSVAETAARALTQVGRLALPTFGKLLEHPNAPVRIQAAKALAAMGPPARPALPQVLKVARKDQPAVRAVAIDALISIRPQGDGIREVLTNAVEDPDPQVRARAAQALEKLRERQERNGIQGSSL
jgi:HEAT repeat protein